MAELVQRTMLTLTGAGGLGGPMGPTGGLMPMFLDSDVFMNAGASIQDVGVVVKGGVKFVMNSPDCKIIHGKVYVEEGGQFIMEAGEFTGLGVETAPGGIARFGEKGGTIGGKKYPPHAPIPFSTDDITAP